MDIILIEECNKSGKCIKKDCKTTASFNKKGLLSPKFCDKHKDSDMINVTCILCDIENCNIQASFNIKGKQPLKCEIHSSADMINVRNNLCKDENCNKTAICNTKYEKHPIFCRDHKDDNMIDIIHRICKEEGCQLIASFGETTAEYCSTHNINNLKDLIHKKCESTNCPKQASCGIKDSKHVQFCAEHCPNDMCNITSNICLGIPEKGIICTSMASCNYMGLTTRLYCGIHKLIHMVDIVNINNLCKYDKEVCTTRATFNIIGEKVALYCLKHSDKKTMVNVLDKRRCEKCSKRPLFNIPSEKKGRFCKTHCDPITMVNIMSPRCTFLGCRSIPTFNIEGQTKVLFCSTHMDKNMVDIRHKRCITPLCMTRGNPKFNDHCFYCFVNLFPNDERVRNYKNKEKAVADFIKQEFASYNWIEDQKIKGGCSRRRPDLLLDVAFDCEVNTKSIESTKKQVSSKINTKFKIDIELKDKLMLKINNLLLKIDKLSLAINTLNQIDNLNKNNLNKKEINNLIEINNQVIIIETDENQHENYDCSCEHKRLMELSRDLNYRPIIMIKFNPDGYIKNGKKITSCWETDKQNGLCRIKKSKHVEWQDRLTILKETVNYWIANKTDKILEIIELFY